MGSIVPFLILHEARLQSGTESKNFSRSSLLYINAKILVRSEDRVFNYEPIFDCLPLSFLVVAFCFRSIFSCFLLNLLTFFKFFQPFNFKLKSWRYSSKSVSVFNKPSITFLITKQNSECLPFASVHIIVARYFFNSSSGSSS